MSETLLLNCWIIDPTTQFDSTAQFNFTIEIAKSETVRALKKAIKDSEETTLTAPAHTLYLWKVSD
jgi:hypothetical protein